MKINAIVIENGLTILKKSSITIVNEGIMKHITALCVIVMFVYCLGGAQAQEATSPQIDTSAPADASVIDPKVKSINDKETDIREDNDANCAKALNEGERLYKAGEFDKAFARFEFAQKNFPQGSDGAKSAASGMAAVKLRQADQALKADELIKGKKLLEEAEALRPGTKEGARLAGVVKEKEGELNDRKKNVEGIQDNPVVNAELKEKVQKIEKAFYEGDRLMETGQYDSARKRYESVLGIDQYNKAARERLMRLQKYQMHAAKEARETARKEAMLEVTRAWEDKVQVDKPRTSQIEADGRVSNVANITRKLQEIMVKDLVFKGEDISNVIAILNAKSREADPEGKGVNFVLKQTVTDMAKKTEEGAQTDASAPAPVAPIKIPPVELVLDTKLPLARALELILSMVNLKYQVDDYAVFILPPTESSYMLVPKTFAVPAGFFDGSIASSKKGGGAVDVKKPLIDMGVKFDSEESKAVFLTSSNKLVVKNTQDQVDVIQGLIDSLQSKEDPQVEIETKVVEFTDEAMKELSFNYLMVTSMDNTTFSNPANLWNMLNTISPNRNNTGFSNPDLNNGKYSFASNLRDGRTTLQNSNTGGVLDGSLDSLLRNSVLPTNAIQPNTANTLGYSFRVAGNTVGAFIRMIDQVKGADLLMAPKVVTRNRTPTKIEVAREFKYPSEFTEGKIDSESYNFLNDTSARLAIPATPSNFKTEPIGVVLSATPTTYPDQRIDLKLEPTITDFEGFINYGLPIRQGATAQNATPDQYVSDLTSNIINQPVFNVRKLTTEITVENGQTIAMGGLMREEVQMVEDKVPIIGDIPYIGRAFRSKIDKTVKKNLVIFVTARLVNSKGKPFYETAE